jgi:DNA-binding protein HU-beta
MTKQQLIETLANETNTTKRQAEKVLSTFVAIVERTVATGEKVSVTGFGTFDLGKRAAGSTPRPAKRSTSPRWPCPASAPASVSKRPFARLAIRSRHKRPRSVEGVCVILQPERTGFVGSYFGTSP